MVCLGARIQPGDGCDNAPAVARQRGVSFISAAAMVLLSSSIDGARADPRNWIAVNARLLQSAPAVLEEVVGEKTRLGITRCQRLASWGAPQSQRRPVGSWGEDIQHVYSSTYVYTRNGLVDLPPAGSGASPVSAPTLRVMT